MLSHLIRCLNRQIFKCPALQTQNYVKRFYTNQDLDHKNPNEGKEYSDKYSDWDETSRRVDEEYYRRYYDTKFDNNCSDRQTDDNNRHKYRNNRNNEKFNSKSYSFSECKYHLFTLRLLEKVGYLGAAIVVGLHFESPVYYNRQRALKYNCDRLDTTNDTDNCPENVCGQCKYCSALLSKLRLFSAPIRKKNYVLAKNEFLEYNNESKIIEITEEVNSSSQQTNDSTDGIHFTIEKSSDPIDDICRQLETASIDYIDSLNNMLGISIIQKDPEEAMRCWRSTKTSSKALFNMGVAYEKGVHLKNGVPDFKQAYDHYMLSASMGHKFATFNLSLFYLQGKGGISKDLNRAESLLRKAAQMGVKPAEKYIEELEQRRRVEKLRNFQTMRSSASAPNLMQMNTCFESYKNENHNKYSHNYSIANRV